METTNLSELIKKELDVNTFLNTLTIESIIEHLIQFMVSGWFLLKSIGVLFYLISYQLFKWGQQFKVYCTPFIAQITSKIYATKPIGNPVSQCIAKLRQPKDVISSNNLPLAKLDDNNSVFPSTNTSRNCPPKTMDSQNEQFTHT